MKPGSPDGHGWPAPAKLNLMLRVVGRRSDGYHLLQTVFQFLDHGDRVHLSVRSDGTIERVGTLAGVTAEQDLVVRAARLLQRYSGTPLGATIELDKRLPMGGGLGGGSSDAATTLLVLNRLWSLQLPLSTLAELGLSLGADVPVFIKGEAAWAEGVGERLQPVELPTPWYLVVTPPPPVATAEIFAAPELTRDSPPITIRDFLAGSAENGCVPVVLARYPEVASAWRWLEQFTRPRLTGTGASLFATFEEEAQARRLHSRLPAEYQGFVARGINRSPLHLQLGAATDQWGVAKR